MQIYLVGGAVRDGLLGLATADRDWVVVGASADDMLTAGFVLKDAEFQVYVHPDSGDEYARARRERKTGDGHRGFALDFDPTITLADDLHRRDLTINALAQDEAGKLIDPFGGLADLHGRRLRMVSGDFRDDPLRVWRAARFAAHLAAWRFLIEPETLQMMRAMTGAPEFRALSASRVWRETRKALECDRPAAFFDVLYDSRALATLMPPLAACWQRDAASHRPALDSGQRSGPDRLLLLLAAAASTASEAANMAETFGVDKSLRRRLTHYLSLEALLVSPQAEALLAWLEHVGAFRAPQAAHELVDLARWRLANIPHVAADTAAGALQAIAAALHAALALDLESIARSDLPGRDKGRQIRAARLHALRHHL